SSSAFTRSMRIARMRSKPNVARGWVSPSRAGSPSSMGAGSSPPTARPVARVSSSTSRSYRLLSCRPDTGAMFDIEPSHAVGLVAGLLMLPVALALVRLSAPHRRLPITTQIAVVLMAITGAIHLALIPNHLETDPITSGLFFFNGVAFIALAVLVERRWWRLESSALIVRTVLGYLVYVVAGLEGPDQVGLATKLIELTALGMILVPARMERRKRDRTWYWALLAAGLDRKSTRLNSSHVSISYAVFCLKKK